MLKYLLFLLVGSCAFRNAYTRNPVPSEPELSGTETMLQNPSQVMTPKNPTDGKEEEYEEISGNDIDNEYKEADLQDERIRIMLQPKKSIALNATAIKTWKASEDTSSEKSISLQSNDISRRIMNLTPEKEIPSLPDELMLTAEEAIPEGTLIEVKTTRKNSSTGEAQAKAISITDSKEITFEESREANLKPDNISVFAAANTNGKQIIIESRNDSQKNLSQSNGLGVVDEPNNFVDNLMSSNRTNAKLLQIFDSLKNIPQFSNNSESVAVASVTIKTDAAERNLSEKEDGKSNQFQTDTIKVENNDENWNQSQADVTNGINQIINPDEQKNTKKLNISNLAPPTMETENEVNAIDQVDDLKSVNVEEVTEFDDASEGESSNDTSSENDVLYEELEPVPNFEEDEIEYVAQQKVNDTNSGAIIIVLPGVGLDQMDMNVSHTNVIAQNMFGSDAMAKNIFHLLVNLTAINAVNERNGKKILEELQKQKENFHHLRKQSNAIYQYITKTRNN